jgi:hypothetical protein
MTPLDTESQQQTNAEPEDTISTEQLLLLLSQCQDEMPPEMVKYLQELNA